MLRQRWNRWADRVAEGLGILCLLPFLCVLVVLLLLCDLLRLLQGGRPKRKHP